MGSTWPKVIRDCVHGIIPFQDNAADRLVWDLTNTREMQRLRRIKQLGMTYLVFPGADHSRFAHSLGVMHTARSFLDRITNTLGVALKDHERAAVLAAAFVHDVGHGPFSHAFEKITGDSHEKRTLEIIRDDSSEIHQKLCEFDPQLPGWLESFFHEEEESSEPAIPFFLSQVISSQLDADRFDYLLRDSRATGTAYGMFDSGWLLQNLFLDENRKRFYLGRKALLQAEQYVFARHYMYQSVYFHKTTRSAEVMLRLLMKRYKYLLTQDPDPKKQAGIVPAAPIAILNAFSKQLSLEEYLELDDHAMTEFLRCSKNSSDVIIRELGDGLLNRRLFKATDVTNLRPPSIAKFREKAKEIVVAADLDPDYALEDDAPSDTPYKGYNPDADRPSSQIYVEERGGRYKELSRLSPKVQELTKEFNLFRYYYPSSIRDTIQREAEPLLKE